MDLLALLVPLGAAGGGSSGFSGGGGGGGGGFSGGGGFGGGGSTGTGGGFFFLIIIAVVVVFLLLGVFQTVRYRRRRQHREAQVRLAAAEAAEDDPLFGPDVVVPAAADLFTAVQTAWDARDRATLASLCGADLIVEWERRLDDFERRGWYNRVKLTQPCKVEYLGLVNREGTDEDRVVVRVTAAMEDWVETKSGATMFHEGKSSASTTLEEYWTLAQRDGRWYLLSIEQDAEGRHNLDSELVASPWSDARIADTARVELAAGEAAPADVKTAEIADLDFDGDARAAALDLSLADGRFAPDVLEIAARRAVAAWAEAVDGPDINLKAIATPEAVEALLHPGDSGASTRLVVRGPQIRQIRITALDAAQDPPTMSVELTVRGARYIENRDTVAVVSGSRDREVTFTEHWTFALDATQPDQPWHIVDTTATQITA